MGFKSLVIFLTLICLFGQKEVSASKILLLIPLTTVSEQNLYSPLANALSVKGHDVTVITRKLPTSNLVKGVKTLIIKNLDNFMNAYSDPVENRKIGWKLMFNFDYDYMEESCHTVYQDERFLKLFQQEKFDVIFTNAFFHNCFFGIFPKYQEGVPIIEINTMPLNGYFHDIMGARMPTSFVPNSFFSVSDKMNFVERWWNTVLDHHFTFYYRQYFIPAMDRLSRHYLGQDTPSVLDVERNVSLMFSNTHLVLTPPRPLTPDIVEIAGLHCRPSKALPKDLDEFLSGAKEGFVYFSMGTILQGRLMPPHFKKMFLKVFGGLKQRVLWKYEADELAQEGLTIPANIKVSKWLPQQDVLGHPNIRAFMTHGGMFSTQEATYHGVPLIGLPVYVDQNMNIHDAAERGYAIPLELLDLTEETLTKALNEILTNKKYLENAKEISSVFREQLESPIDRAIYWTEHIIKYKGGKYLRSASRDLNFIQYHSLDVYFSLIALIVLILFISIKIFGFLYAILSGKEANKKNQNSKKFN